MKDKIIEKIEWYIDNCKKADFSMFGSAGGPMAVKSAMQAFEELKEFVEKLDE